MQFFNGALLVRQLSILKIPQQLCVEEFFHSYNLIEYSLNIRRRKLYPVAVLVYVHNIDIGMAWYQQAFPDAVPRYLIDFDLTVFDINGFSIEIVQADDKVSPGKNGTILYWSVDNMDKAVAHFQRLGAKLYRGPMNIENNLIMCQVEDPFGNLIGLRSRAI